MPLCIKVIPISSIMIVLFFFWGGGGGGGRRWGGRGGGRGDGGEADFAYTLENAKFPEIVHVQQYYLV